VQRVIAVPEKDQVASFARAITRDEFGQFYWDERRESEVRRFDKQSMDIKLAASAI
jgi:hypothetical protein